MSIFSTLLLLFLLGKNKNGVWGITRKVLHLYVVIYHWKGNFAPKSKIDNLEHIFCNCTSIPLGEEQEWGEGNCSKSFTFIWCNISLKRKLYPRIQIWYSWAQFFVILPLFPLGKTNGARGIARKTLHLYVVIYHWKGNFISNSNLIVITLFLWFCHYFFLVKGKNGAERNGTKIWATLLYTLLYIPHRATLLLLFSYSYKELGYLNTEYRIQSNSKHIILATNTHDYMVFRFFSVLFRRKCKHIEKNMLYMRINILFNIYSKNPFQRCITSCIWMKCVNSPLSSLPQGEWGCEMN